MNLFEKANILKFHRNRIADKSAVSYSDLGWRSEESQQKRFEVLSLIGNLNGKSILDVGCGYGDLKSFLDTKFSNFNYIGIDLVFEFIKRGAEVYKDYNNVTFYHGDFLQLDLAEVDYIFASGALGYKTEIKDYHENLIRKMFAKAKLGIGFNMLRSDVFPDHPLLKSHNINQVEKVCAEISDNYVIQKEYLKDDFTIFLYKKVIE